jgi:hypothetical protein
VTAEIPLTRQKKIPDSYIRTSWNFKKANWESFTDELVINLPPRKNKLLTTFA